MGRAYRLCTLIHAPRRLRAATASRFARVEEATATRRNTLPGPEVARAQYDAIVEWGIPDSSQLNRLAGIRQPVLVANGDNDRMIPSVNSQILADYLPNARLRIFPDAAHGFLFQYPTEFAALVTDFLND